MSSTPPNGTDRPTSPHHPPRLYSIATPPSITTLRTLCAHTTSATTYPLATSIQRKIPVYDLSNPSLAASIPSLQDEWHSILLHGPGVFILQNFFPNPTALPLLTATNAAFSRIISHERAEASKLGDHYSAPGANDRIWNSFSKHCAEDPASFIAYYSNPWLARVCESWLGPHYRITAQTNVVKPGGAAQVSHRDYHFGFQTQEACARFPRAMQIASQLLTLQGAVAQTDMPLESGPTRFLPYSQLFEEGFMAYRLPEFDAFFLDNYVSLPLKTGDAVFFNPALIHAAGNNRTVDFERSANLLQVSSAFGKTMETVDSIEVVERCWAVLMKKFGSEGYTEKVDALIAAIGEGYPFPTNLDRRPPAPGGMCPESEQDVLRRAFRSGWDTDRVVATLRQMKEDSKA